MVKDLRRRGAGCSPSGSETETSVFHGATPYTPKDAALAQEASLVEGSSNPEGILVVAFQVVSLITVSEEPSV
jgi:hypothetical protein